MKKILIANRGEIARRVMRTCRAMGIHTVAVFSEPDRRALFVDEADEAVAIGGATPAESYLRADAILEAASQTGADGIHPGYGFLSENAAFAAACAAAGIQFVGPPAEAIAAMGSKIEAKRRMQAAGVPVLASVNVSGQSAAELERQVEPLGLPLLIKASAGGGGRGMRIVRSRGELAAALDAARRESKSAFGDDTVFIEPYVEAPRHVEVQIFGDAHGNVVHLFERECSIQRRHQKIVEESPSPALNDELRARMGEAAVQAGKAIGYQNAGTVEFLLKADSQFFFLEVNTRLQVEHPVTEAITGLDLVRLQIEVARGAPLSAAARNATINGHAIEVRLYAEDPRREFMPVTGMLDRFEFPAWSDARVDSGIQTGSEVSPFYDPLLAKVIVHAPTRAEAAARLAETLARAQIHGLRTNRELLVRLLEHPEFLAGQTDTHFLERHAPVELGRPLGDAAATRLHAVAAALAMQARNRQAAPVLARIPSGWRNNPAGLQSVTFDADGEEIVVEYRLQHETAMARVGGEEISARVDECTAERVALEVGGVRRGFEVQLTGDRVYVDSALGCSEFAVRPRFSRPDEATAAGSLVAPLPGVVSEVKVAVGDEVAPGQVLLVIESMKMLHPIAAPVGGRVSELRVQAASQVQAGVVLAVIDEAND
ncbi:MAG: biotin/lipoyl-binding protein [Pirellulales bacterium]|nr:biotin/lipoyl-binding protein [Pirellulales bacterium]